MTPSRPSSTHRKPKHNICILKLKVEYKSLYGVSNLKTLHCVACNPYIAFLRNLSAS